ncbi:MAG: Lrp/AsnC family transcriptional regulator [Pseudomonadales bacterium]
MFDRIDTQILDLLQHDGRITNQALAEQVNLSESACLRRVRRLESQGLIQGYVALLDQPAAGFPDNVFVRITLLSQQQRDLQAFEAAAALLPEVMECYLMSGDSDFLLRVVVADARDYERLHSQHLTRLPGVDRVHSSFALRTVVRRTQLPVSRIRASR